MKSPHNLHRFLSLHKMLFEMARGNFNMQIAPSGYDDEMESLIVLVNMVAEELRESVFPSGNVNTHASHRFTTGAVMLLDGQCRVVNADAGALASLGYAIGDLLGRPVGDLLEPESLEALCNAGREVWEGGIASRTLPLRFCTSTNLTMEAECTIARLSEGEGGVLSFIAPFLQEEDNMGKGNGQGSGRNLGLRRSDARLVQKVYDYILANLEETLPSIKELSHQFGTNEFKLKDGFRHFFHTSIYQFYTAERLKRAKLMIEQTDSPLKNISQMCGFNSYPNFSKSFKRYFGMPPSDIARK